MFSIALVGNLKKSRECFSLEKHSLNAGLRGIGRWTRASSVLSVPGVGVE